MLILLYKYLHISFYGDCSQYCNILERKGLEGNA